VVRSSLGALTERDFRLLFTGYLTSLVGGEMAPVAVTFAILNQGGSAADVGFVLVAQTVPLAVFVLVGRVVADRLPRRAVMISADLLRAASQGTLAALLLTGQPALSEFMVLMGSSSVGSAFFTPAMTGLIPQVASVGRLQQANAMNGLAAAVAQIAGPAAGGVLVAVGSPGLAMAADAISYLVSASCLAMIRVPLTKVAGRSPFFTDLRLGWREFRTRTWLWVLTAAGGVQGLLVMPPFLVLGAVVAKTDLGGAAAWGAILAAFGAGMMAGGIVLLRIRPRRPLAAGVAASLLFVAPLVLLAMRAPVVAVAAGAFVGGGGLAALSALRETTIQREIPPEMLSRVGAYDWFGMLACVPIGCALVGVLARGLSVTGTLWLAAGALLAVTSACLAMPAVSGLLAPPRQRRLGGGQDRVAQSGPSA
jgi:MFS family permease